MKLHHGWFILLCFLTACSTHPVTDFCDFAFPGRFGPPEKGFRPYGGVGVPQGPILPASPTPGVPGAGVPGPLIPPPLPLPGSRPGIQVQPPQPIDTFPPPPPAPPPFPRG